MAKDDKSSVKVGQTATLNNDKSATKVKKLIQKKTGNKTVTKSITNLSKANKRIVQKWKEKVKAHSSKYKSLHRTTEH